MASSAYIKSILFRPASQCFSERKIRHSQEHTVARIYYSSQIYLRTVLLYILAAATSAVVGAQVATPADGSWACTRGPSLNLPGFGQNSAICYRLVLFTQNSMAHSFLLLGPNS